MNTQTDRQLLRRIAEGDNSALEQLYTRHGPSILNYLKGRLRNRQLAEEILQDVMRAVWQCASTYRGESKVRTWIFGIARKKVRDAGRKHQLTLTTFNIDIAKDIDNKIADIELYLVLEQAFDNLPPKQQEIIDLKFYHGLKMAEIAAVLEIPLGTVQSRLHHAIKQLRRILESEGIHHA